MIGPFSLYGGLFATFFLMWGLFLSLWVPVLGLPTPPPPPPPLPKDLQASMYTDQCPGDTGERGGGGARHCQLLMCIKTAPFTVLYTLYSFVSKGYYEGFFIDPSTFSSSERFTGEVKLNCKYTIV